jgi:hypothetical protein
MLFQYKHVQLPDNMNKTFCKKIRYIYIKRSYKGPDDLIFICKGVGEVASCT